MTELPITERLAKCITELRGKAKQVLLVEDNKSDADMVVKELDAWGYQTTHAMTGEAALEAAKLENFDIGIIDLRLPTMPGERVARILGRTYPMIVIVICSGHLDAVDVLSEALDRQWVLMKKPFDIKFFNNIARVTNQNLT